MTMGRGRFLSLFGRYCCCCCWCCCCCCCCCCCWYDESGADAAETVDITAGMAATGGGRGSGGGGVSHISPTEEKTATLPPSPPPFASGWECWWCNLAVGTFGALHGGRAGRRMQKSKQKSDLVKKCGASKQHVSPGHQDSGGRRRDRRRLCVPHVSLLGLRFRSLSDLYLTGGSGRVKRRGAGEREAARYSYIT